VQWDVARAPTSLLLLVRVGDDHGVGAEVCLRGTGLSVDQLGDGSVEVTAEQELIVIGNLVDALGETAGLGLQAGARYHLTTYGIWGFALICSPTLRSAIDVGLRYIDLTFAFTRIEMHDSDGQMRFVLDAANVPLRLRRFVIESEFAGIQLIMRELLGSPIAILGVSFVFPPPDRLEPYVDQFGVTPEFDAAENVLVCDATFLDEPLPQADDHTAALAQAQCVDLLERRRARSGLAGQVRGLLVSRPADPPSADTVARQLHMSTRTLRQRLAGEGTSFRELLNEVRERLAEEMLIGAGLTVAETAERLGYLELSSFSQAFRRWKGMGPRAYRQRHGVAWEQPLRAVPVGHRAG
jgi:AraC-like DNA-binding protein